MINLWKHNQMNQKQNLNFFAPYEKQKPIVRACKDNNIKYVIYNASRQSGKTLLLSNMAVYYALDKVDECITIISPTDSMVKKIYKQIINSIIHLPFVKSYKQQSGDSEIVFTNRSMILFRSAASRESLRGYSNTVLLVDEAAYIEEETWNMVLAPTLAVRGKKVLFCSTPRGTNFFYKMYMKGLKGGLYRSFKTTYKDNPYANIEFIESQKQIIPFDVFSQEYEGEFVDGGGLFKTIDQYATILQLESPVKGDFYYSGIDIGFKKDATVHIIFNNHGEMVHMDRMVAVTNDEQIRRIKEKLVLFDVQKCLVEANNQGLPVIQQLIAQGMWKVDAFNTTATSKPQIINQFVYAFNDGQLRFLNDDLVKEEFKAFGYKLSTNGHIKFGANYGHDDIVMATTIAYNCYKSNQFAGYL